MARFLIEVPHDTEKVACARAVQAFLETGSHFLANADWGCMDGDHTAWLIVDVDTREEARFILPPSVRPAARIVKLNRFTMQDIDEVFEQHHGE